MVSKATSIALDDPSHFARASAVRLLEAIDAERALVTALQVAVDDSDPLPRRAAVRLMRRSRCVGDPRKAAQIAAVLPRLALDTDVEVLMAGADLCSALIENNCQIDDALAFLITLTEETEADSVALDALKKSTADGRVSGERLATIDEAEMARKRALNRDHYAVRPTALLDDMLAALSKDDSIDDYDDDENMKDCY